MKRSPAAYSNGARDGDDQDTADEVGANSLSKRARAASPLLLRPRLLNILTASSVGSPGAPWTIRWAPFFRHYVGSEAQLVIRECLRFSMPFDASTEESVLAGIEGLEVLVPGLLALQESSVTVSGENWRIHLADATHHAVTGLGLAVTLRSTATGRYKVVLCSVYRIRRLILTS